MEDSYKGELMRVRIQSLGRAQRVGWDLGV